MTMGAVEFFDRSSARPIGLSFEILRDEQARLTPQQALTATGYERSLQEIPNLGISSAAFWLKVQVMNRSSNKRIILSVDHPELDELDIYLMQDERMVQLAHAGQARPSVAKEGMPKENAFELELATSRPATLLLRVRSNKQIQVPVTLTNDREFHRTRAVKYLALGGYAGIMIVMALYNLFVYFSTKDRSYLIYVLYILSITLAQLTFTGITQYYLWPDQTWWAPRASVILTLLSALAASSFMRAFIASDRFAPKLDQWLPYWYGLLILTAAIFLIDPLRGYRLDQFMVGAFASYMFLTAVVAHRNGSRQAAFFLIAWSTFLTGVVLFVLKDANMLPYNALTVYTMPIGSATEAVLLSFGLADRINILRREKERSQNEALRMAQENERIILDQNALLERKVQERTLALQESNDHLKRTQVQLVSAEKMASLGQLTAGIAHEINNPLNFISSNIPPLKRDLSEIQEVLLAYRALPGDQGPIATVHGLGQRLDIEETLREVSGIIASIEEGASRTSGIVRGLRTFSRLDEDDLKEADINEGLRSTLVVLGPQMRDQLEVELDLGDLPMVECYPGKLNQVFMNLLANAVHATKEKHPTGGGIIRIITRADGGQLTVTIADNGKGIPADLRERIFEPFYTTKGIGEGTGLGLSIVHSIVEKHHGRITVESAVGVGTAMTITMPLQQGLIAQRA